MDDWITRQREVEEVYGQLAAGRRGVLVEGLGGSGKTVLARQIADRFADNALRPATWINALSRDAVAQFREELHRAPQGHLVIVDGLDEAEDLGRELSSSLVSGLRERDHLSVLATSRRSPTLSGLVHYQLGPMLPDDLDTLLRRQTGLGERAPEALLDLIDGNPRRRGFPHRRSGTPPPWRDRPAAWPAPARGTGPRTPPSPPRRAAASQGWRAAGAAPADPRAASGWPSPRLCLPSPGRLRSAVRRLPA